MHSKSLCLPAPKRAGTHSFKTLIPLGPSAAGSWPAFLPVTFGLQGRMQETVVAAHVLAYRIVLQITVEMLSIAESGPVAGIDIRRPRAHVQQIAMYTCHVVLRISMGDIGEAVGKHRTTVSYACHKVEDRRDNRAYDHFLSILERLVLAIFNPAEGERHA